MIVKGSSNDIAQLPENVNFLKKGVPEIFYSTLKMRQLSETHLSNVLMTLSDLRNLSCSLGNVANHYEADIIMSVDYSSFGASLEVRSWNPGAFRFGFNGMEKDNEIKGEGNSYTTEFRQYDPRLGRWLSLDPLSRKFPWQSPYVAFDNNPVAFNDPDGREAKPVKQSSIGGGEDPPFKAYKKDGRFFAGYKSAIDRKWENVGKTVNIMAQGPVGVVTSIVDDLSSRNYGSAAGTASMEGGQQFFDALGKAIKTDEVIGKNRKLLGTLFSVAPKKVLQGASIVLDAKNIIDEVTSSSTPEESYYMLTVQFMRAGFKNVRVDPGMTATLISVADGSQGFNSEFSSSEQFENTLNTVFKVMKMVFPPGIWDLGDKNLYEQAKEYVSSFSFINDVRENTLNNQ